MRPSHVVFALLFIMFIASAPAVEKPPLRLGWVSWADAEITAKLAAKAIEAHTGRPVKLIRADIGIQFQALVNQDIDVIPMVWLPASHKPFWDKYGSRLQDLGVIYEGRVGWAIPDSIPASELASIDDLKKPGMAERFEGVILTSELGNGQYVMSQKAIAAYGLTGYRLLASSEAGMLTQFGREVARGKFAVMNAWNPHWMFARWKLRYLHDPRGIFGGAEQVHAVGRPGFREDEPQLAAFFARYTLPLADLEALQMQAQTTPLDQVLADYYQAHQARFAALFAPASAQVSP